MTRTFVLTFLRLLLLAALLAPAASFAAEDDPLATFPQLNLGQDWPWWRGPHRNGVAAPASKPPVQFGPDENIKWRTPVPGRGHSSPIVVGGRVYLTTADVTAQIQSVVAFDLESGQLLWQQELNRGGFPEQNHPKNTEASATIASDGELLFVTFFHHKQVQLTALNLVGETVWQTVVGPFDPKKYEYGYAPSPLVFAEAVIVSREWDGESGLTAFERGGGSVLWSTKRPSSISFSSPVAAKVAGREQLFLSGMDRVSSFDPLNGRPLWEVPGTTAATCGTMVWEGNLVFASGGYPKAETLAVVADGSGRVAWRNEQKSYEQSMIIIDGYLYAFTDKGVLYCWRASDGSEMWRERLAGPVSASPVYAGGHIYWANELGTMYVFLPNSSRFELAAENRLGQDAFASPAVVGNSLLLRLAEKSIAGRQEYLICIGE